MDLSHRQLSAMALVYDLYRTRRPAPPGCTGEEDGEVVLTPMSASCTPLRSHAQLVPPAAAAAAHEPWSREEIQEALRRAFPAYFEAGCEVSGPSVTACVAWLPRRLDELLRRLLSGAGPTAPAPPPGSELQRGAGMAAVTHGDLEDVAPMSRRELRLLKQLHRAQRRCQQHFSLWQDSKACVRGAVLTLLHDLDRIGTDVVAPLPGPTTDGPQSAVVDVDGGEALDGATAYTTPALAAFLRGSSPPAPAPPSTLSATTAAVKRMAVPLEAGSSASPLAKKTLFVFPPRRPEAADEVTCGGGSSNPDRVGEPRLAPVSANGSATGVPPPKGGDAPVRLRDMYRTLQQKMVCVGCDTTGGDLQFCEQCETFRHEACGGPYIESPIRFCKPCCAEMRLQRKHLRPERALVQARARATTGGDADEPTQGGGGTDTESGSDDSSGGSSSSGMRMSTSTEEREGLKGRYGSEYSNDDTSLSGFIVTDEEEDEEVDEEEAPSDVAGDPESSHRGQRRSPPRRMLRRNAPEHPEVVGSSSDSASDAEGGRGGMRRSGVDAGGAGRTDLAGGCDGAEVDGRTRRRACATRRAAAGSGRVSEADMGSKRDASVRQAGPSAPLLLDEDEEMRPLLPPGHSASTPAAPGTTTARRGPVPRGMGGRSHHARKRHRVDLPSSSSDVDSSE